MSVGQFLVDSIEHCRENDVKIEFYPRLKLPSGNKGDFWDYPPKGRPKVLRVATENFSDGSRWDWLEIFVHEYCHMLQAIDNTKVWRDSSKPVDKIFYWIDDNDEYPKPTKADIRKVIAMESDCDRRAVEVIKNYKIPINVNRYIKRSNLYMWFYPEVHKRGKWVAKKKRMPYMIKEALDLAPAKFLPIEDYMTTPPELVKLFDKHTF